MSAVLATFNALKAQIETVASVKTVKLFNSQIDNEARESPFTYPAVFIEFQEIDWGKKQRNIKEGDSIITLHVALETLKDETASLPDVMVIADAVHLAVEAFGGDCFNGLSKEFERQDTDHDNCIVWQIDYSTLLTDDLADPRLQEMEISAPTLEVTGIIDIDNDVIRTGDGDFT